MTLLSTRSKVAPIKPVTIPRLELCAAKMLVELMQVVCKALNIPIEKCRFWGDSTIVLRWLTKELSSLEMFVANRIAYILEHKNADQWRHVPTADNPADLISRGKSAADIIKSDLWWHGPKWMDKPIEKWPQSKGMLSTDEIEMAVQEEKIEQVVLVKIAKPSYLSNNRGEIVQRFNNLYQITKTIALVLRFVNNFIHKYRPDICPINKTSTVTMQERMEALHHLIKIEQNSHFSKEIEACKNNTQLKKTKLIGLRPFLDGNGLLRVCGRLENSNLPFDAKFPIALPNSGTLINRIISDCHHKTGHGGCRLMLQYLRQKYWIINMRKIVKALIHNCTKCIKASAKTAQQQMGSLPEARVTPGRCFQDTGMDYFGPFNLKARHGRCKLFFKGYGIIFKCLSTLASALELVEDMTKDSFFHAFARIEYTRGRIEKAWTDNGLYFVGAANELKRLRELWETISQSKEWEERGTEWHFIPPAAPHQGGVWESSIKLVKNHIDKIVGDRVLTPEEMRTIFAEISGYLNSLPLVVLYDNEVGASTLTPGHFLVGEQIVAPPTSDIPFENVSHLKRWKMVQELSASFWKEWSKEYVIQLFDRLKWKNPVENIKVGDIVLVKHETLARTKWPIARVVQTMPGKDGLVRSVQLLLNGSLIKRPIQKLCILPVNEDLDKINNRKRSHENSDESPPAKLSKSS